MFMVANFQSDDTLNIRLRTQTEDNTSDFSASGLNAGRKLERWRLCITRLRKDGIYVCLRRCCGILSSGLHSLKSKTFPKNESRKKKSSEPRFEVVKSSVSGLLLPQHNPEILTRETPLHFLCIQSRMSNNQYNIILYSKAGVSSV